MGDLTMLLQRRLTTFHACRSIPIVSVAVEQTLPTGHYISAILDQQEPAVKGVFGEENPRSTGCLSGKFDGRFNGLGP